MEVITPNVVLQNDNHINEIVDEAFNMSDIEKNRCGKFGYISSNNIKFKISQHIWAFIKLLLRLNTIGKNDDELYSVFMNDLDGSFADNKCYLEAKRFVNSNESNVINYENAVNYIEEYLIKNEDKVKDEKEKYLLANFISFVNYNGSETYLTNGAFMDVVINGQKCKVNKIKLSIDDYIDSFIENLSDFMLHYHKDKYLKRAKAAFVKILSLDSKFNANMDCKKYSCKKTDLKGYINGLIEKIDKIHKNCSDSILNCQTFLMMDCCIKMIIAIFDRYLVYINDDNGVTLGVNEFSRLEFENSNKDVALEITNILQE
jgi:hypothetical protein